MRLIFVVALLSMAACSDDSNSTSNNANNSNNTKNDMGTDSGWDADAGPTGPDRTCDDLDPSHCALPWPSNAFLVPDENRETGYTLTFSATTLPANKQGIHIDPTPYTRMDGYGLGAPAIALFPNVDDTSFADEYHVEDSMADDAQILLFEVTDSGITRIPYFVDHDLQTDDPERRVLIVHPAVILKPATRYGVAFRNLKDTHGATITPSPAFAKVLAGESDPNLDYRKTRFDELLPKLEAAGVTKNSLTLAYDWNTASEAAIHQYVLKMRDEVLTQYPDGPELTITKTEEFTEAENENIAVRFTGQFEVPNYIKIDGNLKYLRLDATGKPVADGIRKADFWINIPRSALDGTPQGLVQYGHGLFGDGSQVNSGFNARIGNQKNYIFYGATLWGMGSIQAGDAVNAVLELSAFPSLADQLYQGMIEWVLIARAMKKRFPTMTAVTDLNVNVESTKQFYSGISQGGIFGPTFVALSPDIQYGHAGVPGHTYSTLLPRSKDFDPLFAILRTAYPDVVDQLVALNAIQLLWDGTDPVSYFWNLEERPIDGSTGNQMIWAPGKGDFQVAVIQNETLARTPDLGVALMSDYDAERTVDLVTPATYPHRGSAVVLYDFERSPNGYTFRNQWPSPGDLPPIRGDESRCPAECPVGQEVDGTKYQCCDGHCCFDPHELPRRQDHHNDQMIHFFESGGEVIDVCGGDGCTPL